MRLSQLKKNTVPLVRPFKFPPSGDEKDQFTVSLQYTSPKAVQESIDSASSSEDGKKKVSEQQKEIALNTFLTTRISSITGVTVRKLTPFVELSQESVHELGGLDTEFEFSSENVKWLIDEVPYFANFCMDRATNLSNFQNKEWEAQIENLKHGPVSSLATA